ncbi:MAG TPA: exodeoxyribonuclease VII small subunit [Cyanobacteria bacterium UBA11149]|nr:exodeoxyribonuclease VII small subunit [Cyanobacteria bacterium UBA11367]HBE58435.1 exodeoxyribonuclease VII small subunit [Cyanobacteria bacterium UBA11366]HBK63744.1 exodeoxyribonuclease VII small subunit [Cyanobacteria bacterium UBA11166]HBR74100.1 exodeoxyribonuclease VII small subunit [Cyanobacteria bacterium UBA11159]HBS70077.1 exodeoxyribonuclease VII small subunit [Cyanobacteria bacterium UBA11153]HBW90460.1 exodeoxyribonuclease VII small subunit [Cyanobacteria bacterium UBA11149]H
MYIANLASITIDILPTPNQNITIMNLPDSWKYEATVARVEKIIKEIESGELELAEVFQEFSTAMEYLRQCEAFLNQRQEQMDLLIETLESD